MLDSPNFWTNSYSYANLLTIQHWSSVYIFCIRFILKRFGKKWYSGWAKFSDFIWTKGYNAYRYLRMNLNEKKLLHNSLLKLKWQTKQYCYQKAHSKLAFFCSQNHKCFVSIYHHVILPIKMESNSVYPMNKGNVLYLFKNVSFAQYMRIFKTIIEIKLHS